MGRTDEQGKSGVADRNRIYISPKVSSRAHPFPLPLAGSLQACAPGILSKGVALVLVLLPPASLDTTFVTFFRSLQTPFLLIHSSRIRCHSLHSRSFNVSFFTSILPRTSTHAVRQQQKAQSTLRVNKNRTLACQ